MKSESAFWRIRSAWIAAFQAILWLSPAQAVEDKDETLVNEARGAMEADDTKLDPSRNVIWDAGFDTGYGNGFWTTLGNTSGPSRRNMWNEGVMSLRMPIASRLYYLPEGTYTLCAWVKRNPKAVLGGENVTLELTNFNYVKQKKVDSFSKTFPIEAGEKWQRVGWTFSLAGVVRNNFHLEIKGGNGILVDAVCLVPGSAMPDKPLFAADIEAGFDIHEEDRTYVEGDKPVADLIVVNHGPTARARVRWQIFDHREDLVKEGVFEEEYPGGKVMRKSLPVGNLPYGAYRLASSVDGWEVLGDGMLGVIPKVDAKAFPYIGVEPCFYPESSEFTLKLLKKLGMNTANILSTTSVATRWAKVEAKKGEYLWRDDCMLPVLDSGMDVIPYMSFAYQQPKWAAGLTTGDYMHDLNFKDEKAYTDAFCAYVDAYVRHYKGRLKWIMLEDEVHHCFGEGKMDLLVRIYSAAYTTAKKAAADMGNPNMLVGINATGAGWWSAFMDKVPREQLDLISSNTAHRPGDAAPILNAARQRGIFPEIYHTAGVGQKSPVRPTSLLTDHSGGAAAGTFAAQAMLHAWLSRPYGTENPKDGPLIHLGFYDGRTLANTAYCPSTGLTGIQFDNSPGIGWLSLAVLKSQLPGMRAVRDPLKPFAVQGVPTDNKILFAYPFRNEKQCAMVICTSDVESLDSIWSLSGMDFKELKPTDLFAQPIPVNGDGSITARGLPIYLSTTPDKLDGLVKGMAGLKAEIAAKDNAFKLEAGAYMVELDPALEGYFRLWRTDNGKRKLLIDRLMVQGGKGTPVVSARSSRVDSTGAISYGRNSALWRINLTENGCRIIYSYRNVVKKVLEDTVQIRLGAEGAGSRIVIQEGNVVRSGKIREDYGRIAFDETPPAPQKLPENAARVVMDGFATFDMAAPTGTGFTPQTGFIWKDDGRALLEASYTLQAYTGNGSRGAKSIELVVFVK